MNKEKSVCSGCQNRTVWVNKFGQAREGCKAPTDEQIDYNLKDNTCSHCKQF